MGVVNGCNFIFIIVFCYCVIGIGGELIGFVGGLYVKKLLLVIEGIFIEGCDIG